MWLPVARVVAQEAGVDLETLLTTKTWAGARRRQIAMLYLRERGLSYPKIAFLLGHKSPKTVIVGCERMRERLARPKVYPEYSALYGRVAARLHDMRSE